MGAGYTKVPLSFEVVYNPADDGFCVSDSLNKLGVKHTRRSWMSLQDVLDSGANYAVTRGSMLIRRPIDVNEPFIVCDVLNKHAYVAKLKANVRQLY